MKVYIHPKKWSTCRRNERTGEACAQFRLFDMREIWERKGGRGVEEKLSAEGSSGVWLQV